MINAFLVAYDFPDRVVEAAQEQARRDFTIGRRPPQTVHWANLRLVRYRHAEGRLNFEIVHDLAER